MVIQLIGMNYHICNRADYLDKKKKAARPNQKEEGDAQKNRCAKEGLRAKERLTSAEKLGLKNKTTHKLISKSRNNEILINRERRLVPSYNF